MNFFFEKTSPVKINFGGGYDDYCRISFAFRLCSDTQECCYGIANWSDHNGWSVERSGDEDSDYEDKYEDISKYILNPSDCSRGWRDDWFSLDANTHSAEECEDYEERVLDVVCNEFTQFCYLVVETTNQILSDAFKSYAQEGIKSKEFSIDLNAIMEMTA